MIHASEQDRPDVQKRREDWPVEVGDIPVNRFVFLDETCVFTAMTRLYGWGLCGQRVIGSAPVGHYKMQTMVAGIRLSGVVAPMVFDGVMNGDVYCAWVKQALIPELSPGDVIVADNLSSHKNVKAVRLIESVGCRVLFLPPYSPDLNPIEELWSKVKSYLRGVEARTIPALYDAVGDALKLVTLSDCLGYISHCGYGKI